MASVSGSGIKQPYYVPEPSGWPIVGSIGAFVMFFSFVLYLHPDMLGTGSLEKTAQSLGPWVILPGLAIVLYTMFGWWYTVAQESSRRDLLTPPTRLGLRYAMFLFIASEVMFFVA